MTSDQLALLRTILDNPDDDTPRLVYADWLEENWEPDRARFIRDHISIRNEYPNYCDDIVGVPSSLQCHNPDNCEPSLRDITGLPAFDNTIGRPDNPAIGKQCTPIYRRGFLDEVRCTLGCWLEFGPEIMRWHPVRVVRATDRSPFQPTPSDMMANLFWFMPITDGVSTRWRLGSYYNLPESILDLMLSDNRRIRTRADYRSGTRGTRGTRGIVAFASRTDAEDALSDALIRWAKQQTDQLQHTSI